MERFSDKSVIEYFINITVRNIKYLEHRPAQIEFLKKSGTLMRFNDKYYICVYGKHLTASDNIYAELVKYNSIKNIKLSVYLYDPYINLNILVSNGKNYFDPEDIDITLSKYVDLTETTHMRYPTKKMNFNMIYDRTQDNQVGQYIQTDGDDDDDTLTNNSNQDASGFQNGNKIIFYSDTRAVLNSDIVNFSSNKFLSENPVNCLGGIVYNKSDKIIGMCNSCIDDINVLSILRIRKIISTIYSSENPQYFGPGCLPLILDPLNGRLISDFTVISAKNNKKIILKKDSIISEFNGIQLEYGNLPMISDRIFKKKISFSAYLDNNHLPGDIIELTYISDSKKKTIRTKLIPYDLFFLKMTAKSYIKPKKGFVVKKIKNMIAVEIVRELPFILDSLQITQVDQNITNIFNCIKSDISFNIKKQYIAIDSIEADLDPDNFPIFAPDKSLMMFLISNK